MRKRRRPRKYQDKIRYPDGRHFYEGVKHHKHTEKIKPLALRMYRARE